jgi:hypothetical protein
MSEASEKLALEIATDREDLAAGLREMSAFEQACAPGMHYAYPMPGRAMLWCVAKGLIRMKGESGLVRLTPYGREVVNSLDALAETD